MIPETVIAKLASVREALLCHKVPRKCRKVGVLCNYEHDVASALSHYSAMTLRLLRRYCGCAPLVAAFYSTRPVCRVNKIFRARCVDKAILLQVVFWATLPISQLPASCVRYSLLENG